MCCEWNRDCPAMSHPRSGIDSLVHDAAVDNITVPLAMEALRCASQ